MKIDITKEEFLTIERVRKILLRDSVNFSIDKHEELEKMSDILFKMLARNCGIKNERN